MKKLIFMLIFTCVLLSCNSKNKEETGEISSQETDNENTEDDLDKVSVYEGLLPCGDCEGIETVLKIYQGDGTMETHKFELITIYKKKQPEKKRVQKGNYNLERGLGNDP
ncbi:MAG: copper resistance protein NlpE N-terminal domain-containing protein, partial [Flavobacterium sp.]